jgi:hypothetical protein
MSGNRISSELAEAISKAKLEQRRERKVAGYTPRNSRLPVRDCLDGFRDPERSQPTDPLAERLRRLADRYV